MKVDFGPGISPPFLTGVNCSGKESALGQCPSVKIREDNETCYAAGVLCDGQWLYTAHTTVEYLSNSVVFTQLAVVGTVFTLIPKAAHRSAK